MAHALKLCALLLAVAATPSAPRALGMCRADDPEVEKARIAFTSVDSKMGALRDGDETRDVLLALKALLGSRCFQLSRENPRSFETESALALRTWWASGGRDWVLSYLPATGDVTHGERHVVLPPDLRGLAAIPRHGAISALACARDDAACDEETTDWQRELEDELGTRTQSCDDDPWDPPATPIQERVAHACAEATSGLRGAVHYLHFRKCLERSRPTSGSAPRLARLKAPAQGWWVLRGRRGHYDFCDELHAYDLRSGAAFIAQSCSELALREGGHVDGAETERGRKLRVRVGSVSPASLRELAWLAILAHLGTDLSVQTGAQRYALPRGLEPALPRRSAVTARESNTGCVWTTSGHTSLSWTWFTALDPVGDSFSWPSSSDPVEDRLARLLERTEKTLVEGCPSSSFPASAVDWSRVPSVNAIDAPEGVEHPQDALVEALRSWRQPTDCR